MKECFKCKSSKDLNMFYKHKGMADGHLNKCKDCTKKDANEHRYKNIDKVRDYDRNRPNKAERVKKQSIYHSFGKGKEVSIKAKRKYRESNPLRYKANCAVSNAIRDGRLSRPKNCSKCLKECKPQAHHDNYNKPLNVRWLCIDCHNEFHRNAREILREDGIVSEYMIN